MKLTEHQKPYVVAELSNGVTIERSDKDGVKQYLDNRIVSMQNTIAHYKSEIAKHETELAQCLQDKKALEN